MFFQWVTLTAGEWWNEYLVGVFGDLPLNGEQTYVLDGTVYWGLASVQLRPDVLSTE